MKKTLMALAVLAFFAGCAKTNSPEPTNVGHTKEHKCGMLNSGCDMAKKQTNCTNAKSCNGKTDINMTKPSCGCKGGINHHNHGHHNMTKEVKKTPCH